MTQLAYDGPLGFGLFLAPFHSKGLNPTYAFERDLTLAEHLDRIDFDEIWFGEHHSGAMEMIAAPELMVAAAAQRTKHVRLGTGVKSLPFHNPLMLAETMAQLDHMTRGRAIFGVGPGALPTDAHMLGLQVRELRPHMDEALDTIMALMRGETVDRQTKWFALKEARLHVGCYSRPMMEMAVTSVRSPAGVMAAGRHGLGVLTLGPTTDAALAHHADNWRIHEEECARNGHVANRAKWRITVVMHIAETREKAFADTAWGFHEWIDYTHDVIPAPPAFPRGVANPAQFCLDNQLGIIGTPADAVREIERIQRALGGFGTILVFGNDLAPWTAQLRSFELLAEFVKPHFNRSNDARRASYAWCAANQAANREEGLTAVAQATETYNARRETTAGAAD
jgi:limonene 1,2-monooxygenase